ncbi:MAG TPA: hypothetical protein EYG52_08255, partial [Pseudomonadales bacterium]|nr:hypothetical protein [Pseudomonadales bacterium]
MVFFIRLITLTGVLLFTATPSLAEGKIPPFSIKENIVMLYYKDLSAVVPFYEDTLGLKKTFNQDWSKIYQLTPTSFVGLIQESEGS